MTDKQALRTDLLIVNALETAKQLRELQDSPVAEAIFESIVENENGKEIQFERPISDLAYAAFLKIERLVEALESAEKLIAELEALQSFRTAFNEWHDKTEWVQGDKRFDVIKPWGKHRADVLKLYIDHLESKLEAKEEQRANWFQMAQKLGEDLDAAEKCIAELESRTVTLEPFRSFVTDADITALHRFAECCDDHGSGGHDLKKEQVRRLEAIGALQRSGRISYITDFGDVLISITAGIGKGE
ncbi:MULTISPECIES: hypothetical protein [Citrobacter]|uniref:hypothetical protein n=1 Tax=Citrobacter TaxID=544 RepID=UPI0008DE0BA6|nr:MULTISPECIES: hypothetical protein [Citrobacter]MDM3051913.1 hypothetical protein [Citrobacter sp. CK183]MDM9064720.1 hypothetical protein [Citrobacter koseri]MDM9079003.1 hypothetical protein [Citrobacter koseri]MDM9090025.1 hypothetical protein [Citrobacter koseri]MDM9096138.1 hypothetical protein [Citrobacter koseri]